MGMNMPCEGCGHTIGHSATCPSRAIIGKGTPKTPYEEIRNSSQGGSIQGGQAECGVPEGVLDKRKLERERDEAQARAKGLAAQNEVLRALVRHYHQLLLVQG